MAVVALWFGIWGVAHAASDALGEHVRDIVQFFGWLITAMLSIGIALIVFIYKSSMRSMTVERDLKLETLSTAITGDIDAIGAKVNGIDSRVTKLEGGIEGVYKTLSKDFMKIDEHGRICDRQRRREDE